MTLKDAGEESADGKKELTNEHDAHKVSHQLRFPSGKVRDRLTNWFSENEEKGDNDS